MLNNEKEEGSTKWSIKLRRLKSSQHFGVWLLSEILGKKRLIARGFTRDYLRSCSSYRPGASLLVCTRKKIFAWGCGFFVSDDISERLLDGVK